MKSVWGLIGLMLGASPSLFGESVAMQFFKAVHAGNEAAVQTHLDKGIDVNKTRVGGIPALSVAAQQNRVAVAEILLKKGADPNAFDRDGRTALMWAAMDATVNRTSTPAVVNSAGTVTPGITTTTAIVRERTDLSMLRLLMANSAKVNQASKQNVTALYLASGLGFKNTVSILLEGGADPNIADRDGLTPLMAAISGCDGAILTQISGSARNGTITLPEVTRYPDFAETVRMLLARGANLEAKTKKGVDAKSFAAKVQLCKGLPAVLAQASKP